MVTFIASYFLHCCCFPATFTADGDALTSTRESHKGFENPLEKEMAMHSSILAYKIQWTKEPGGLQSIESQRVRHDWMTKQVHMHVLYMVFLQ